MKIGFIGAGNMGGAIIRGFLNNASPKNSKDQDEIFVYDKDPGKIEALISAGVSFEAADSIDRLVWLCDVLILCVKPNIMDEVLEELAAYDKLIISIAAGISIDHIKEKLGQDKKVVRIMPNTPAMVGEGMSAMSASDEITEAEIAITEKLFNAVGFTMWVQEEMMDIVTGISGSSPAYAYLYMEGLVSAGMEGGLSKEEATIFAAQSTLGAAAMVIDNLGEVEPRQLCTNVCSPGGTTIEAVKVLEEEGFTETVNKAAKASAAKSKLMTR
jgi:pyrroline-5-carboxylate reductase